MVTSLLDFLGVTGYVSSDVQFAIGSGLVFLLFVTLLVGLGALFGRWFR